MIDAQHSATEATLLNVWKDLLGHSSMGAHENLFDAGADSLSATLAAIAIESALNVEISAGDIYAYPTCAELAVYVCSKLPS